MTDFNVDAALQALRLNASDPQAANDAITSVGKASSQSSDIREKLAEPAVLDSLLSLLDASLTTSPPAPTALNTLRCIGNASIDNPSARQIITYHGFAWTQKLLSSQQSDTGLKVMAFNCLHNICMDFEPAQKRCYTEHVHEDVLRFYFHVYAYSEGQDWTFTSMLADFLLSICAKREKGDELRDDRSLEYLLEFPHVLRDRDHEVEVFATAVEVALIYLRDEVDQAKIIERCLVEKAWQMLEDCEDSIVGLEDEEDAKLLVALSTSLTWCLSDIAARPEFAMHYSNRGEFINGKVMDGIKRFSTTEAFGPRLVSAACQVLGNLLWSLKDTDQSTEGVEVMDLNLHSALMSLTTVLRDAETLYSITGLMIQMCRYSKDYRTRVGEDETLPEVLRALCGSESKEVRQGGMKLLQLLGKDNAAIRERYAALAAQVMQSLVAEQNASAGEQRPQQNGGSIVELPD